MRSRLACLAVFAFASLWVDDPACAQTAVGSGRTRISVNAGLRPIPTTFDGSSNQQVRLETGIVNSTYRVKRGPSFDGGVAVTTRNGFGVGLTGSWSPNGTNTTVNATIPHPFFFEAPRTISGAPSGLSHDELAVHVQGVYVMRPTERLDIVVSGGPSFFRVKQTLVSEVTFSEAYPYDSATFTGVVSKEVANHKAGFNVGADIGVRLRRSVGVGGLVRFSHAAVGFALPNGTTMVEVDAGGLQAGAGLRLYF